MITSSQSLRNSHGGGSFQKGHDLAFFGTGVESGVKNDEIGSSGVLFWLGENIAPENHGSSSQKWWNS